jgi:uncharacterized protein (DUF1684 family)
VRDNVITIGRLTALLLTVSAGVMIDAAVPPRQAPDASYVASIERWRAQREAELRSEGGWLAVVGLSWLQEGSNTAGSAPSSAVRLDAGSAPARVGVFEFSAGVTTFAPEPGVPVRINGQPATRRVLRVEAGQPDQVQIGTVTLFIIKRGSRYGVRVRDTNAKERLTFGGMRWFPVQPAYRVTARFVPHTKPATIMIANVLGDLDPYPSPGYVVFSIAGREVRLHPVAESASARRLFFIIKDQTSGKETYGGGRFLYTDPPKDGQIVLDFNKAENPPCAFTAFATCPLPPKENVLPVRIEAGEQKQH